MSRWRRRLIECMQPDPAGPRPVDGAIAQARGKAPLSPVLSFLLLVLAACGGGSGGDSHPPPPTPPPPQNAAPVAHAGNAQTVHAHVPVTLNGAGSRDPDGSIASWAWTQTAGPSVTLTNATSATPGFIAPQVDSSDALTFSLVVTDNRGAASSPATVQVSVEPNARPVALATAPAAVRPGNVVTLDASGSSDADDGIASYAWTQTAGPQVSLSSAGAVNPGFVTPQGALGSTLTFSLVVRDRRGAASAPASVTINVEPAADGVVTGIVSFARVPFSQVAPRGLDYANPLWQPARGVMVRAVRANDQLVLATGTTDSSGAYSLPVPPDTGVVIEVIARMQRTFPQPLPHWDVRVQDGAAGSPYRFTSAVFNSSLGAMDIEMHTGISPAGTAVGPRHSGPFAILDTLHTGLTAIADTGIAVEAVNPNLVVDWGSQNQGTYFTAPVGQPPQIKLLSDLTEDTDEFDQHVIAHELGHYLEYAYSRADSIGGSHGLGDRLDARVAFGEGFGYAFAAIVLDDPDARDSFVFNGTSVSSGFNVEVNPPAQAQAGAGCWCSETSVWSILWDLYDADNDGADQVTLGFKPIWQVITGAQKRTRSLTTIYSFIAALKSAQPAEAAAIDALVAAQNITTAGLDAFASTEVQAPFPGILPLFAPIVVDGPPVVVRNTDDGGRHNKAGNRRFLRFTAPADDAVRISVSTSNPDPQSDPDFYVYRGSPDGSAAGGLWAVSFDPPPQAAEVRTIPVSAGVVYIIDAYDCANGCDTPQGTPGDYDLTVTVTTAP